jgi:hypothetical protein
MRTMLTIAKDLRLPAEAVTQTFAILAKRGAGKTYTAAVMVEEMLKAGLPVVVGGPVGVWWGLRSSADGQQAGLPIVIMGASTVMCSWMWELASLSRTSWWTKASRWCSTCRCSAKASRRAS